MQMPQHLSVWLRTFDEPGDAIPFRLLRDPAVPAATDTCRDLEPDHGAGAKTEAPGDAGRRSGQG